MRLPETPARGTRLEERFRAWRQQGDSPEGLKERTTPRPFVDVHAHRCADFTDNDTGGSR